MAALRQAGLVETTRGRGGGTVVTLKPGTPSARAAARISDDRRQDWLDALDFRRIVEPGAAALAASRPLDDVRREQLEAAHAEVAAAGKPAEHRQADSRFHLTIASLTDSARTIEAVTVGAGDAARDAAGDPGAGHQHRPLRPPARRGWCSAILAGKPDRARKVMEEHCDDTAALLRGLVG